MAGLKEIKRRLGSVKNTRQITRAMKLVSAAKLARAQGAVVNSRAYSVAIGRLMEELMAKSGAIEINDSLTEVRDEVKRIRLVVVGASRGLCGAFNTNLNKKIQSISGELLSEHPAATIEAVILGKKPSEYCRSEQKEILESFEALPEDSNLWPIEEVCRALELDYADGKVDKAYLVFTKFISTMTQEPQAVQLLPFSVSSELTVSEVSAESEGIPSGETIFEPSVTEIFSNLIPRIVRVKVRQACLDSKASEHASRMTAMDAATRNAGELIDKLTLTYNRLRQSSITGELLDIVGGVEALNQGD